MPRRTGRCCSWQQVRLKMQLQFCTRDALRTARVSAIDGRRAKTQHCWKAGKTGDVPFKTERRIPPLKDFPSLRPS